VGHPVATNADARLRGFAESRGWMIENFTGSKESNHSEKIYGRV